MKNIIKKYWMWILIVILFVIAMVIRFSIAQPPETTSLLPAVDTSIPSSSTPDETQTVASIYGYAQQTLTALATSGLSGQFPDEGLSATDLALTGTPPVGGSTESPGNELTPSTAETFGGLPPNPTPTTGEVFLPTPTSDNRPELGIIPGLSPENALRYLEDGQFSCTAMQVDPFGIYFWNCSHSAAEHEMFLTLYSRSNETLDLIELLISSSTIGLQESTVNKAAFVASIPYDGADRQAAKAWIEQTLPYIADQFSPRVDAFIGSVPYSIEYTAPIWIIRIGYAV